MVDDDEICRLTSNCKKRVFFFLRNKNEHILSIRNDISGDRKKYEILNKYDLIIKNVDYQDNGHYVCQNFEQQLCRTVDLTILSK